MSVSLPFTFKPSAPGSQHSGNGGSLALQGSTLVYFMSDANNNLQFVTLDVSGLQEGDPTSVATNGNWAETSASSRISTKNGASLKARYGTAAVELGGKVYCFWVDGTSNSDDVYAMIRNADGTYETSAWKVKAGSSDYSSSSSLAATVTPDGSRIVLLRFGTSSMNLHSLVLDPNDLSMTGSTWTGAEGTDLDVQSYNSNIDGGYSQMSAEWFPQAGGVNWMLASFYSNIDGKARFILYKIGDDGTPVSTGSSDVMKIQTLAGVTAGCSITRDPAGRLYVLYSNSDRDFRQRTFDTNTPPTSQFEWPDSTLPYGATESTDVMGVPIFIAANQVSDQSVSGTQDGTSLSFTDTTTMAQYGLILYDDSIRVMVGLYGQSVMVPSVSRMTPTNPSSRLLSTLMDSFPFPNENLGSLAPSQFNSPIIAYTYGASSQTSNQVGMKETLQFGIKTEVDAGVAEETEFRAGPVGEATATQTVKTTSGFTVYTTPVQDPPDSGTARIGATGEYYGASPPDIVEMATLFIDASGVIPNGVDAPLFSAFRTVKDINTHRVSGQFAAYAYTPGDIDTYQASEIDARMRALYDGLSASEQANLDPGYASGYMENIVRPNAMDLGGDGYLEFTVDGAGGSASEYEQIDEVMALVGLSIQGSEYIGESTETTVSAVFVEETFSEKALVGMDFSVELTAQSTQTNSWGISFSANAPQSVSGSTAYTVRMYVLKPSNIWARELQYFGSGSTVQSYDSIDFVTSQPTKIVFEVLDPQPTIAS